MYRTLVVAVAAAAALILSAPAAGAADFDPNDIAFPVDGEHRLTNNFAAPRDGGSRSHEGEDIMADKGVPVLAAADGVATWVSTTKANCCRLQIDHGNGWATRYIHLNNDTQNDDGTYTDDDQGWGIADGIVDGTPIEKGQLIGWVGDSGNAKGGAPHLHFEIREDGEPIDPYPYLLKAKGEQVWQFRDTTDSVHRLNIEKIYQRGTTRGCNPPTNDRYCPESDITRGEMAAFISRTLGLTERSGSVPFGDVGGHLFEGDIDRIVTAGIGFGCDDSSYCPNRPLLREEMAEMLVRAFGYDNPDDGDFFVDDDDSVFEESINKLAHHGVTLGCNPPDNDRFCPYSTLTRAEMASFFVRALGL